MEAAWILIPVIAVSVLVFVLLLRPLSRVTCPSCHRPVPRRQDVCSACGYVFSAVSQAPHVRTRLDRSPSPPPGQAPYLAGIAGPPRGQNIAIASSHFTIGRSGDNDLHIEGRLVSRKHALIVSQNGRHTLYDQESTNGTWVDGRRVSQHVLQPGEQIQIGPAVFVFQQAGAVVESQAVRSPDLARIATPPPEVVAERVHAVSEYHLNPIPGGSGGAARVYKGVSKRDGSVVAVKMLYQTDQYLRAKFEQKGRKIGLLLRHPHIAEVYHYGQTDDGSFYILMEFVENGSLRSRIRPGGMPHDQVIQIVGQVCDALHYAHSKGVIHRDIKPENILFDSREDVKLVDFGIAKLAGARTMTQDGLLIGTPLYMSYEQAKGQQVDPRSDIYALGIVLYEMLTGLVPFTGQPLTVIHNHIVQRPTPPSRVVSGIPSHLEQVVMKALEKEAGKRFRSAEQMARALGYTSPFWQPRSPMSQKRGRRQGLPRKAAIPQLRVVHSRQTIPLAAQITELNRNRVNPDDRLISRERHARILHRGADLWLEDAGSTNGTYLNGQRLFEPAVLNQGDEIRLGSSILRLES